MEKGDGKYKSRMGGEKMKKELIRGLFIGLVVLVFGAFVGAMGLVYGLDSAKVEGENGNKML